MEFDLSPEQELIVETARKLGRSFGPGYWREADRERRFPREAWQAVCKSALAAAALCGAIRGSREGQPISSLIMSPRACARGNES